MHHETSGTLVLPPFPFRIEPEHVVSYRAALGEPGTRVPFAMGLRALASDHVAAALKDLAQGRLCIHLGQEVTARSDLCAGVDYICDLRFTRLAGDRIRIEQRLRIGDEEPTATFVSDIRLVAA
ncbi:hypothetical protein [Aestuariivirga sp.]|uniref:hypothetical protein n=1 Tax=Aestuariivirga sp. TaxID=2650926 RepID=UPI003BA93D9C